MQHIQVLHGSMAYLGGFWRRQVRRVTRTVTAPARVVTHHLGNAVETLVEAPFRVVSYGLDVLPIPGSDEASQLFRQAGNIIGATARLPMDFTYHTARGISDLNPLAPLTAFGNYGSDLVMDNARKYVRAKAKKEANAELKRVQSSLGTNLPTTGSLAANVTADVARRMANDTARNIANQIIVALNPARDAIGRMGIAIGDPVQMGALGDIVARYVWDKTVNELIGTITNNAVRTVYEQLIGFTPIPEFDFIDENEDETKLLENIGVALNMTESNNPNEPSLVDRLYAKGNLLITEGVSALTNDDRNAIGFMIDSRFPADYRAWLNRFDYQSTPEAQAQYWLDLQKANRAGYPTWSQHYSALMARAGQASLAERQARADQTKALWQSLGYPDYATFFGMTEFARTYNKPIMPFGEYVLLRNQLGRSQAIASQMAALQANKSGQEFAKQQIAAKSGNILIPLGVAAIAAWSIFG